MTAPPPSDAARRGLALLRAGQAGAALPLLDAEWRLHPGAASALHPLASCLQQLGRAAQAQALYREACAAAPADASLHAAHGRAALLAGAPAEAAAAFRTALQLDARRQDAATLLAQMLREDGQAGAAAELLQALAGADDALPELVWEYAQSLWADDRIDAAAQAFGRFARLRPDSAAAQVALGRFASARGDFDAALVAFARALDREPGNAAAWWELVNARRAPLPAADAQRLGAHAAAATAPGQRMLFADALARHHERSGDYAAAGAAMERANAAHRALRAARGMRYDPAAFEAEVDFLIRFFDGALLQRLGAAGVDGARPLFVFGLPRSGTTLTEQLLNAHPLVAGIGEPRLALDSLQQALAACAGVASRLAPAMLRQAAQAYLAAAERRRVELAPDRPGARTVDSQPDNTFQAAWLALAFPHATLVHCLRDPRDVALSCWSNQFTRLGWTFELEHIAHRIEQHRRLLAHWRTLLGPRLLELRYERLAAAPAPVLRGLLQAAGLPWDDAVLRHAERPSVVRNASQVQVREPVNTGSVGRWRRFESVLAPILPRLDAIAAADGPP